MTREEWRKIEKAARIFGLGESATLAEIKKAFRTLTKKHHPDALGKDTDAGAATTTMRELIAAYETLLNYCSCYRFPLTPGPEEPLDEEDWWMDRFGNDPLWGPGRAKKK
jgi:preprotein translocase subunit Sec63